jgi:hypothetical protein
MTAARLAFVCLLGLSVAGCGGGTTQSGAPPTETVATSSAPANECNGAALPLQERFSGRREVTKVDVTGQCTRAAISTTLSRTEADAARELCDIAGPVAYAAANVTSVSVRSANGEELAVGTKGASCKAP